MCSKRVKPRKKSGPEKQKDNDILECIICFKTFKWKCLLEDHIRRSHTHEKPFGCPTCKTCFPSKDNLRKHKVLHRSCRFACSKCSTICKSNTILKQHNENVHNKKNLKIKCPEAGCNRKFKFQSFLKRHLKIHQDVISKHEFACAECNMCWGSINGYRYHMKTHHNPDRPTSQCDFCRLIFASEELLHQHQIEKGHDKPKLYNCGYCRHGFSDRWKLKRHLTSPHHLKFVEEDDKLKNLEGFQRTLVNLQLTVDPVLPCDSCESSYNTEEELEQHKLMLHKPKQPKVWLEFKCEEDGCDRVFERKSSRTRHLNNFHNKRMSGRRFRAKVGRVNHKCGHLKGKRQRPELKSNKKAQEKASKTLLPEKPTRSQPIRTSRKLQSSEQD